MKKTVVVNFYSGPGAGKSTMAANIFSLLKVNGYNCELVTEYAKKKVWEESFKTLQNQIYVFGKQQYSMWICSNHVDIIVTDSPLLLSIAYGSSKELEKLVYSVHNSYENINIFIDRDSEYNPIGRTQSLDEAIKIDNTILDLLKKTEKYVTFKGNINNSSKILDYIISKIL